MNKLKQSKRITDQALELTKIALESELEGDELISYLDANIESMDSDLIEALLMSVIYNMEQYIGNI